MSISISWRAANRPVCAVSPRAQNSCPYLYPHPTAPLSFRARTNSIHNNPPHREESRPIPAQRSRAAGAQPPPGLLTNPSLSAPAQHQLLPLPVPSPTPRHCHSERVQTPFTKTLPTARGISPYPYAAQSRRRRPTPTRPLPHRAILLLPCHQRPTSFVHRPSSVPKKSARLRYTLAVAARCPAKG